MKAHLHRFINQAIDWLFRRRSVGLVLIRFGVTILALVFAVSWVVRAKAFGPDWGLDLVVDSGGGTLAALQIAGFSLGAVLILAGLIMEWRRFAEERRRLQRKKVIAIEVRGLRDTAGTPVADAVPADIEGHREALLLNLRQGLTDGKIDEPAVALRKLMALPGDLERRTAGLDRSDVTVVYGGLAPVPLTFLTGALVDDEGPVRILDWDRHRENWRTLDEPDDEVRFETAGLATVEQGTARVSLAVSVSYGVDLQAVHRLRPDAPLVTLVLPGGAPDCHWSEDKQRNLGQQFLETLIALANRGVGHVDLFLAAQNSVAFRFGRLYDRRNLPPVTIYQYEKALPARYPWGVRLDQGVEASVIETAQESRGA